MQKRKRPYTSFSNKIKSAADGNSATLKQMNEEQTKAQIPATTTFTL